MKRILVVAGIFLLTSFFMIGCQDTQVNLNEIDIEAIDAFDVPVGTYTIDYTIEDISSLIKEYGAEVGFLVTNQAGDEITVSGNTFFVEAGEVYTVTIRLLIEGELKEKTITITAIQTTNTVVVMFALNGGTGYSNSQVISEGSVPDLAETPTYLGYVFSGWYVDELLTTRYMGENLFEDTTLYASWVDESASSTVVSFDLNGGVGDFPDQMVTLGQKVSAPLTSPTKEGYDFIGWYTSLEGTDLFQFEQVSIYGQTIIYAIWEVSSSNTFEVNYDLNGAIQTSTLTEDVIFGNAPLGLSFIPIRSGYIFAGWAFDQNARNPITLSEISMGQNITLFAVWHIDFTVIDGSDYFHDFEAIENSSLSDGVVDQKFDLVSVFDIGNLIDDFNIDLQRSEYGVIYSHQITELDYYSSVAKITVGTAPITGSDTLNTVYYQLLAEALLSDTFYQLVFYFRFEDTIVYSETYGFSSYVLVPTGSAIGNGSVISGGYYEFDNGTEAFRPSMFIEIYDGFSATIDNITYSSYSSLYMEGTRRLVTIDQISGKHYLHVFHLNFQTPHVIIDYDHMTGFEDDLKITYDIAYPHDEYIYYHVSEVGVIYSYEHPFLKLSLDDVHKSSASINSSNDGFETNNEITSNGRVVYVRGYAIINNKISYSDEINKLEMTSSGYSVTATYYIDDNKVSPEYGYSSSFGSATMRVAIVSESGVTYTNYTNSILLTEEGQYFVIPENWSALTMISDVLIIDDYPPVIGIEEGGIYSQSVMVSYDMFNPYWYVQFDGGDYFYLPAKVMFSVPGYYTVFYRSGSGMIEVHFQITN